MTTTTKESKIKLVKKSNILLLNVVCTDEHYGECNFAVFEITDEVIEAVRTLKSVIDLVKGFKGESPPAKLYKMSYWSPLWDATFLHEDDIDGGIYNKASDHDYNEIHYLNKMITPDNSELSVECSIMHVYDDGIRFDCLVRHSEIKLETVLIPYSEFGL